MFSYEPEFGYGGYVPRVNANQGQLADVLTPMLQRAAVPEPPFDPPMQFGPVMPQGFGQPAFDQWDYRTPPMPQAEGMGEMGLPPGSIQVVQMMPAGMASQAPPPVTYLPNVVPMAQDPSLAPMMQMLAEQSLVKGASYYPPPPEPAPAPVKKAAPRRTSSAPAGKSNSYSNAEGRRTSNTASGKGNSYSNAAARGSGGIRKVNGTYTNAPDPSKSKSKPAKPSMQLDSQGRSAQGYYGPTYVENPRFHPREIRWSDDRGEDFSR